MENTKDILKELREISPAIANISRNNVYSVPLNYFDGLAGNIMQGISADIAGSNFSLPSAAATPFTVPGNYFNNLAEQILARVTTESSKKSEVHEELEHIAPLLNTISKHNVYHLPAGYFQNLEVKTAEPVQAGKVRTMGRVSKMFRYASAAAITGLLAVGAYFFTNNDGQTGNQPAGASINISAEVDKVSNAEIVDYLQDNSTAFDMSSTTFAPEDEIDINAVVDEMSDEEIRQYLKENEEPKATISGNS